MFHFAPTSQKVFRSSQLSAGGSPQQTPWLLGGALALKSKSCYPCPQDIYHLWWLSAWWHLMLYLHTIDIHRLYSVCKYQVGSTCSELDTGWYREHLQATPIFDGFFFCKQFPDFSSNPWNPPSQALNGTVYDLSDFLLHHPEQRNVILAWAGRDASAVWNKIPGRGVVERGLRWMDGWNGREVVGWSMVKYHLVMTNSSPWEINGP